MLEQKGWFIHRHTSAGCWQSDQYQTELSPWVQGRTSFSCFLALCGLWYVLLMNHYGALMLLRGKKWPKCCCVEFFPISRRRKKIKEERYRLSRQLWVNGSQHSAYLRGIMNVEGFLWVPKIKTMQCRRGNFSFLLFSQNICKRNSNKFSIFYAKTPIIYWIWDTIQ